MTLRFFLLIKLKFTDRKIHSAIKIIFCDMTKKWCFSSNISSKLIVLEIRSLPRIE